MLSLARLAMLKANEHGTLGGSEAIVELDKAKDLLKNSSRISQSVLDGVSKQKRSRQSEDFGRITHATLIIMLQSLNALGYLEIRKQEFKDSGEASTLEAEKAFDGCITSFKECTTGKTSIPVEAKVEYLSCLNHLVGILSHPESKNPRRSKGANLEELIDKIKRDEVEVPPGRSP